MTVRSVGAEENCFWWSLGPDGRWRWPRRHRGQVKRGACRDGSLAGVLDTAATITAR